MRKNLIVMLAIVLSITCMPLAAFAGTNSEIEMQKGKVTIVNEGHKTTIDMGSIIIVDENGNIVPKTRAEWDQVCSITLKNGYTAYITYSPVYYGGSEMWMYASCSSGDVSKLQAEARKKGSTDHQVMWKFTAEKGTWYGSLHDHLPWIGNTYFLIRNVGSEPITVDSVTYYF